MVAYCSRSMLLFVTSQDFVLALCPWPFLIHVQIPFQQSCGWTDIVFSIDKNEVEREIFAVTTKVSDWIHLACTTLSPTRNIRLAVVFYCCFLWCVHHIKCFWFFTFAQQNDQPVSARHDRREDHKQEETHTIYNTGQLNLPKMGSFSSSLCIFSNSMRFVLYRKTWTWPWTLLLLLAATWWTLVRQTWKKGSLIWCWACCGRSSRLVCSLTLSSAEMKVKGIVNDHYMTWISRRCFITRVSWSVV